MKLLFLFIGVIATTLVSCNSIAITKRQHRSGYAIEVHQSNSKIERKEFTSRSRNKQTEQKKVFTDEQITTLPTVEKEKTINLQSSYNLTKGELAQEKIIAKPKKYKPIKQKTKLKSIDEEKKPATTQNETDWAFWSGVLKFLTFIGILLLGSGLTSLAWAFALVFGYGGFIGFSISFLILGFILALLTITLSILFLIKVKYFKKKRGITQ